MSVDRSYLPRAVEAGADVFSHCLVEKIETRGSRATGVSGRLLNRPGGKPGDRLRVRARRVVVACGAWHTPTLLRRSGVGRRRKHVGRHLTLHPAFRMIARFDEEVSGWKGALQSAFTDAFERELLTLVSVFVPVGVIAATMPGVGAAHAHNAAQMRHLAMFGGAHPRRGGRRGARHPPPRAPGHLSHGQARPGPGPGHHPHPRGGLLRGRRQGGLPPVLGIDRGYDADAFRKLPLERMAGRRFECSSQHPLGTARMSREARDGVVDGDGRAWELDELYVVDGSTLPTSLGVNPQQAIMSVATRMALRMAERPLPV